MVADVYQSTYSDLADLLEGEIAFEGVSSSIDLCRSDFAFHDDCVFEETTSARTLFQLGFCLEGGFEWEYPDLKSGRMAIDGNCSYVQLGSVERSLSTFAKKTRYHGISLMLEPERFESLISCFQCKGAINDLRDPSRQKSFSLTPKVRMIVEQMCSCSLCDSLRSLYLEGKVLELLAVYFDEVVCQIEVSKADVTVSREDFERLLSVKQSIDRRFAHPLTIAKLAHEACLNEYKLKRGFKHCFGTTILEYIMSKRMEMASVLVDSGDYKVKDIAWMVGYSNVSHFIDAFKRHFGHTPGELLRRR